MRKRPSPHRRTVDRDRGRVIAWLDARTNYERVPASGNTSATFGLGRMRRLLRDLGNPHLRPAVAHVAGTKGKGSTVTMLASILEESGHRVGRYLSPHVHAVEERIAVNGESISSREFVAAFEQVIPIVDAMDRVAARTGRRGPTWFEAMTAAAFVHFAHVGVDVAVLETGLGGRLDATNICQPLVTVITSISLDHMKLLGPTIPRIATEKAGIIKRGCPVVCGATQPSARRTIAAIAARRRARLLQLGHDFIVHHHNARPSGDTLSGGRFDLRMPADGPTITYTIALAGRHQVENAALAVAAVEQLRDRGIRVTDEAIARGLARATLPARIETVGRRPLVIVDAAHNVASMESLVETIRPVLGRHRSRVLVFAASADKQIEKMLGTVRGFFDHVVITRYLKNPRAAPIDRLRAACRSAGLPAPQEAASPAAALRSARSLAGSGGMVVVAGSFFLAAEIDA
jgi:dihydrofolate synthase/folylpolyglutamate synthase